jgi:5-methylcytosine-specific restriction endonuclease McrA
MSADQRLNEPVLILNVNYEPIHVCTTRRALSLVLAQKAEMLLNGRGTLRSSLAEYDIPSVIKLRHMVRRPRIGVTLSKREILRRDDYTCQYCGGKSHILTVDHVVPRRLGGEESWTNLVAACPACNRHKGGNTPEIAHMQLIRQPFEPSPSASYRFGRHLGLHAEWAPFIAGW